MRIATIGSVNFPGGGDAAWLLQDSSFLPDVIQSGTGNVLCELALDRAQAGGSSVILTTPRAILEPGGMVGLGASHLSVQGKRVVTFGETGAGTAAAENVPFDLAVLAETGLGGYPVLAAGSIAADGSIVYQGGLLASAERLSNGAYRLDIGGGGYAPVGAVLLASIRSASDSPLRTIAAAFTADLGVLRVTTLREDPGDASVLTDEAFDFVLIGANYGEPPRVQPVAMAAVAAADGTDPPTYVYQRGFASTTRHSTGVYSLHLDPARGYDPARCAVIVSPRNESSPAMANVRAVWTDPVSPTEIRCILRQQDIGGSINADFDFDIALFAGG